MIGKTVSHYEITGELGTGGMGAVYRARDTRLGREVALKFLHPAQVSDPDHRQRFLHEARSLASLDHPNICTVYDLDEDDGRVFIAMAIVEGQTLAEIVGGGPLESDQAVSIIREVASGLISAHDKGIVHRDVKSANVMVTRAESVKILDFGLAWSSGQNMMTHPGTIMGTPTCMSPEQATGGDVDHRTDIWAMGVLLYEMLRGRPPFHAEFEQAVVYRVLNEEPEPLVDFRPDIGAGLQRVIDIALAKDPTDRYQSAAAFLEALDDMEKTGPSGPAPRMGEGVVAVLEFRNISGNPDDGWLAGGIAETIMVDLKRIEKLTVVPRDKVGRALGDLDGASSGQEAAGVGVVVGAAWVVWGGYQKMGDSIRITAHASVSASGEILHSLKIDGSMGNIFDLQDRIVAEFLTSLEITVTEPERDLVQRHGTSKEKAYEYYAKGRQIYNRGEMTDVEEVRGLFEKALEIDPGYALACSGLSSIYLLKFIARTDPADLDAGIRFAEQAISLDSHLADPYAWLTYFLHRRGDDSEAVEAGRRATALESNNGVAHYFLGVALVNRPASEYSFQRFSEGVTAFRKCLRFTPHYQAASMMLGWAYMLHGQYDKAEPHLEHAAELERSESAWGFRKVGGMTMLGNLRFRQGRHAEAKQLYLDARDYLASNVHVYRDTFLAQTFCGLGDVSYAALEFDEALENYGRAVELARAKPERLGIGYFFVRGCSGMGRSFYALDVNQEARGRIDLAATTLLAGSDFNFLAMWEGNFAQAHFELARAGAMIRDYEQTMDHLTIAVRLGWRDAPSLASDPVFKALEHREDFRHLQDMVRNTEPLP
jgi:tetratricopeptide (TPR) repeat protein/predicted Ser/Thr protein kinase